MVNFTAPEPNTEKQRQ